MTLQSAKRNIAKELWNQHKERQTQESYYKDFQSLLKEPTKGNAIRIISKRLLQYVYKLGGGPGLIVSKLYGKVIDQFIDSLYFYTKEIAIKEKLEQLAKNAKEAKVNSLRGIKVTLEENAYIKSKHMPTVWQYCILMGVNDPQFAKNANNYSLKLQEITKRKIKAFDLDILLYLATDQFIRSVPGTLNGMKKELQDTSNAIENAFRALNLHAIELIRAEVEINNFRGGLGSKIDDYIKLRNAWALWIDLPAMSRNLYEEGKLPELNFEQ